MTNRGNSPCRDVLASVDHCAYRASVGTVQVEESRWLLAQKFEAETWRQIGDRGQDRDATHMRQYDNYVSLLPRRFERVLEVGCGPWTQTRQLLRLTGAAVRFRRGSLSPSRWPFRDAEDARGRIRALGVRRDDRSSRRETRSTGTRSLDFRARLARRVSFQVGTLTLSDPLLETYVAEVPSTSYASNEKARRSFPTASRVEYVAAGGERLHARGNTTVVDLATGARSSPTFKDAYDLVVIINVLEHCKDALATLQNVFNAVRPGGYLVLEDRSAPPASRKLRARSGRVTRTRRYADSLWHRYDHGTSLRFPDRNVGEGKGRPFWDVGHPLQPKRALYTLLARYFDVIHWRNNLYPDEQSPDEVYFIGRKRVAEDDRSDLAWYVR